ncbi:ATP synthase F1 subunit epsilon [Candidatus Uhrbacteria bacterium]|nr:ATP synthase F1 subunit epsilon [Candidatus Uhrbacteria bacterium]
MLLKIITPEHEVFSDDIDQVTLPTMDGEITVLPHHIPLVGILKPGEILIKKKGDSIPLAVSGGMLQVRPDMVLLLADTAERVEEIIEERAEQARLRAEQLLTAKKFDTAEYATIAAKLEKELARLKVVRKHRGQRRLDIQSE